MITISALMNAATAPVIVQGPSSMTANVPPSTTTMADATVYSSDHLGSLRSITCAPRRYSIKSLGYIRLAVSNAARPISRLDARASTSSLPLVRTTLKGHSSAYMRPLLKRCLGGSPLFSEEEIPAPVELENDLLDLLGG